MQSGHSKRMEELIYGILTTENPFSTQSEQASFRKVSVSWHRFIRRPSATAGKDEVAVGLDEYRKMVEEERWAKLRKVNLNVSLRDMLGLNASFRGSQFEGLKAILSGEPRVVMVMRTRGGKSLMFMLPAFCSVGGVTVVVVPLISLRSDLERICKEIGLNAGRWPDQTSRHARIVLVTPESAVTKAFNRFINGKLATGELDRIVVDESHIVLGSTETWRPKVLETN
jgi:superfamily II DNA helicase RecQ